MFQNNSAIASRSGVNISTHAVGGLAPSSASSVAPHADSFGPSVVDMASAAANGSVTLFDAEVPVHVKHLEREEVYQPLGVCVSVGRGGANGVSKCVTVRLTDPKDPFFLFSMTLLEDDYGRFKEKHELMVDFIGFPRDLVQMLGSIGASNGGPGSNIVTFVADTKDSCVLRILERTEFRALEHIALNMSRQGDVGQKKYLAEKFQHYLSAYHRSEHDRKEETLQYERLLSETREALRSITAERDELLDRTRSDAAVAASSQMVAIASLKDQHNAEMRQAMATADAIREDLSRKIEVLTAQHASELKAKDAEIALFRSSATNAEGASTTLSSQLRMANDSVVTLTSELEHIRRENETLNTFRQTATQRLNENELTMVANTERIRHLTETLKSREEDIRSLREAQGSQDGYAKMLAGQLSTLQEKVKASEASLTKAHHILGTQVQALRAAKDKNAALKGQIDANECLVGEKNNLIERLRGDLLNSGDKVELLQSKVTELKDQLIRSEEQVSKLTVQLKQNEDALIHMQRMSSGFGARTFGVGSSSVGPAAGGGLGLGGTSSAVGASLKLTGGPGPFSASALYRQFAAGSSTSVAGVAGTTSSASGAGEAGGATQPSVAQPEGSSAAAGVSAPSLGGLTGGQNQLLTGYNSLASGAAVLGARPSATAFSGASSYPYTSSSPVRTPLAPSLGTNTTASVSYLPPKTTLQSASYAAEKPSSYFAN